MERVRSSTPRGTLAGDRHLYALLTVTSSNEAVEAGIAKLDGRCSITVWSDRDPLIVRC